MTKFIRRWLLHVLPAGLHRVRHYGFMHSSSKRSLEELRLLIAVSLGQVFYLLCHEQIVIAEAAKMLCPQCGGAMISLGYWPPVDVTVASNAASLPVRAPP